PRKGSTPPSSVPSTVRCDRHPHARRHPVRRLNRRKLRAVVCRAPSQEAIAVVERGLVGRVTDSIGKTLLHSPRADRSRLVDRKKADLEILVAVGRALEDAVNGFPAGFLRGTSLPHQLHDQEAAGVAYDLFTNSG